jgi:serine/threonine protein kinase/Flp pilus assembly protein TadD
MVVGSISHYNILKKLGAGGMGEVYLAQDTSELGRWVALKILPAEVAGDKSRLQRFIQEARTVSNLNHPNILTVHEFGQTESASFMATEYVDGVTLRQHLSNRRLKLVDILEVTLQIVAALNAAHEAGVTHRDLKPENIMVRRDQIVKVLDFGLAKLSEPAAPAGGLTDSDGDEDAETKLFRTEPGLVMGTVGYMSPEQSVGRGVDQRSDIWSVGVVLYEMITGRLPFQGKDIHRQIIAIQDEEPVPLSQMVEGVPERLEEIVEKCLAKEKDERYQTAKDLLIDLRNLRRKLDVEAEIERTMSPDLRTSSGTAPSTQGAPSGDGTTDATNVRTASSAEYIVTGIKQHKLAAVVSLLLLATGITVLATYLSGWKAGEAITSIAVMPFVNESGNPDVEYLSDGMTETLIKSLTILPNLNVKPRSSVFRYKGKETDLQTIARELNVQVILNGRVAQRGDQLTLSLELVDVRKDSVIWTEQYQRKTSDLVTLQSEIGRDVSSNLKARLSGAEETSVTKPATSDAQAYQAYLKGRYYWNRRTAENLKKAIEQFKTATDRDPNYALAFVGLADCYAVLHEYAGIPTSETIPRAKAYAERALSLDDQSAEPHASLAAVNEFSWQWEEAEKEFKRAIEINPNYATAYHWYSILLKNLGRNDEAAAMIERAHELDPLSSVIGVNVSRMYQLQNNHEASIENSLKVIELDPNFGPAYQYLGLSYLKLGRHAESTAALEKAAILTNRSGLVLSDLGYVYGVMGKPAEAIAIVKELESKYARKQASGQFIAAVYAGLGEKEKAFEWLEKDFQNRDGRLPEVRWQLSLEPLHDDPRFKDLLRRMNPPV